MSNCLPAVRQRSCICQHVLSKLHFQLTVLASTPGDVYHNRRLEQRHCTSHCYGGYLHVRNYEWQLARAIMKPRLRRLATAAAYGGLPTAAAFGCCLRLLPAAAACGGCLRRLPTAAPTEATTTGGNLRPCINPPTTTGGNLPGLS